MASAQAAAADEARTARLQAIVCRLSAGRLGHTLGRTTRLLLTTRGRRSGLRTVTLVYLQDGPRWIVAASNGGADLDPAWWLNL